MIFEDNTLEKFEIYTGFDITQFFEDFIDFNDKYKQNIVDYYSGISKKADSVSFNKLNDLIRGIKKAINLFSVNQDSFQSYGDWNLLEQLENIETKLETISNSSKFLRSSIAKNDFSPNIQITYGMKQGETLEAVSRNILLSPDPNNDWVKIAMSNDMIEEDYTSQGGNLLKVTFQNGSSIFINSVVDTMDFPEKVLGLDLDQKFTFENNDLKTLPYKETFIQTIKILLGLRKGDNPEFPNDGVDPSFIVGSSTGALTYPNLFRQMYAVFAKDDTIKSLSIKNLKHDGDALFLDFEIESRLGERSQQTISF